MGHKRITIERGTEIQYKNIRFVPTFDGRDWIDNFALFHSLVELVNEHTYYCNVFTSGWPIVSFLKIRPGIKHKGYHTVEWELCVYWLRPPEDKAA